MIGLEWARRVAACALIAATAFAAPRASCAAARVAQATGSEVVDDAATLHAIAMHQRLLPRAPRLPRAAFLARSSLRAARLSPDGTRVAAIVEQARKRSVWFATAAQPAGRRVVARTTADRLAWSRDGRWLFLVSAERIDALATDGQTGSGPVVMLGGRERYEFVSVDASMPAAVVLLRRPARASSASQRWQLLRAGPGRPVDVLHEGTLPIIDSAFAPGGRLTHLLLATGDGHSVVHRGADGHWRRLARCERLARCRFVGTPDGRTLWMTSNHDHDLQRLVALDATGAVRPLASDPSGIADLDDVAVDPVDGRARVATYRSTVARNVGLDADARAVVATLASRFPRGDLELEPAHGVQSPWLVHERGASVPGERLHLFEPRSGRAVDLFASLGFEHEGRAVAGALDTASARQVPIAWRASDGMRLYGFLTLPPGIDPAHAPLVVSVHGGPWNHVAPGWDRQAQFLANRGYVVFSPNFRGSTGYGLRYLRAARGDFGGTGRVQGDIVEGTRWLLAQGIGDPQRVAITGASFGGYSTLLGLTFAPDLFKAGIAIVPPTDFGRIVREYAGSSAEYVPGIPIAMSLRDLGVDPSDAGVATRLRAQSPITRAAAMRRPLLICAGGEDDRVPIRGVTHYAATLHGLGKDVSLFVDAAAAHRATDPRTAEATFYLEEALLHRALGGPPPEPPSAGLRQHIERNLRLRGETLRGM